MTIQLFRTGQDVIIGKAKKTRQQKLVERTHVLGEQIYEVSGTGTTLAIQARDNYRAILTEHAEIILPAEHAHASTLAEAKAYVSTALRELAEGIELIENIYLSESSSGLAIAVVFSEYDFEAEHKVSNVVASLEVEYADIDIDVYVYYLGSFEEGDVEGYERIYAKQNQT